MKYFRILPALAALAFLSACTTPQNKIEAAKNAEFVKMALAHSPEFRQRAIDFCRSKRLTAGDNGMMVLIFNLPAKNADQVLCERMIRGVASGRIGTKDILDWKKTGSTTPEILRVLQGR
ncbi:hypothetical protein [Rhizobium miluonense]|uniref:Lipoprotein n=1 Tax=Rhizobium miluonense TaxID=411945 RepID=A0A1C3WMZ8_9HYPH|nr:hypothetical protein [Rhizobium miluonense]SCB41256.1 hypothetical protein GA0061102_103387 [Rhizobium miluonense]